LSVGNIGGGKQVLMSGSKGFTFFSWAVLTFEKCGFSDGLVHVWDVGSGELVSSFKKHAGFAVQSLNLFWAPSGCVLDDTPRVVVGRLQKFPADSVAALAWNCMPKVRSIRSVVPVAGRAIQKSELTAAPDLEARVLQLEAENAELHEANKRLYEFNIEKVAAKEEEDSWFSVSFIPGFDEQAEGASGQEKEEETEEKDFERMNKEKVSFIFCCEMESGKRSCLSPSAFGKVLFVLSSVASTPFSRFQSLLYLERGSLRPRLERSLSHRL
jgi:hypothetical protein